MSVGLARITINAPHRRVDVALPEHVPLAELLPELLRHAGESLADDGEKHGGWVLRRTDGVALGTTQGLYPQGVRDGEVLHLVPAREQWPELEYDDVVEAIAEGARRRGSAWTAASTRTATLTGAGVVLALGLLAVLEAFDGAQYVALGVAVLLAVAAVTASRAYGDARAAVALGAYAMPYAFVGGALVLPRDFTAGALPWLSWLGGPELLAGAVALLLTAALGGVGVAASPRLFTAGVMVGVCAAIAALVGRVSSAAGGAAALLSILVCGIGVLPLLAIRFGKMPTPPVTLPSGTDGAEGFAGPGERAGANLGGYPEHQADTARERPDRATVYAAVTRTEELLAGLLLGHVVLAVGAFLVLARSSALATQLLIGVCAAALLLRSRLFVTLRQRVPLVVGGLVGVLTLGYAVLGTADATLRLIVTGAAVVLAIGTVAAGATYAGRSPSPYLGRAADLVDSLAVVSVIPIACAVLGLYEAVGSLAS